MSESKPNSNPHFETWLATATKGLCDPAIARIREEMEAHYSAANDDAIANGVTADQAALYAVTSLGDAYAARRAFRRQHLTCREQQMFQIHANLRPSVFWIVPLIAVMCFYLLVAVLGLHKLSTYGYASTRFWELAGVTLFAALMVMWATVIVIRRLGSGYRSAGVRFLTNERIWLNSCFGWTMSMFLWNPSLNPLYWYVDAFAFPFFVLYAAMVLHLALKLRRVHPDELRPT